MNQLTGFTDQPKQQATIVLADGSRAVILMQYLAQQTAWSVDVTWGTFSASGLILVASPNWLRQFREVIPFGLMILTAGNLDPTDQEAFVNGSASLFLLDPADVTAVEAAVYPGK